MTYTKWDLLKVSMQLDYWLELGALMELEREYLDG